MPRLSKTLKRGENMDITLTEVATTQLKTLLAKEVEANNLSE